MDARMSRVLCLLSALCFALPAASCGPDFPEAIFVKQYRPDEPYAKFVAGRLGVPRESYRVRQLAIAYDVLTGRSLSADEQRQAIAADVVLANDTDQEPAKADGYAAWMKARSAYGATAASSNAGDGVVNASDGMMRSVPGASYEQFVNCLDDGFATAARTLAERQAAYGARSAEVVEWVHGQDEVFSNCADVPGGMVQGVWRQAAPPPAMVPAVLTNAPRWLKQDRAYQIAAAQFYSVQYADALKSFQAIAADKSSPWSVIAEYLTVRTMIRAATIGQAEAEDSLKTAGAEREQARADEVTGLKQAQAALKAMQGEERMRPLAAAIGHLLDWLALRIDPKAQQTVLAARLHGREDSNFGQDLIDLTYASEEDENFQPDPADAAADMRLRRKGEVGPGVLSADAKPGVAMTAWLRAVMTEDEATALANWRAHHETAWLVAAMMSAKPGDASSAELIDAAAKVAESDPGYVAVTYHRLRLMGPTAAMRSELLKVQPAIERTQGPSATNLFAALDGATAPSLEAWLRTAGQVPAAISYDGDEFADEGANEKPMEQVCGPARRDRDVKLFTPPAADALNVGMPLSVMARAAESGELAPNLRFELAQSTWTRAVLLNRPEIARRMTPILEGCRAAWKDVLTTYDGAHDADARHVAGLLAMMRFASTEPDVRAGEERAEGFATYSLYRDNWWGDTVTTPSASANFEAGFAQPANDAQSNDPVVRANAMLMASSLNFLTAEERANARREVEALEKIPGASDYFAREALAWWRAHPKDTADAELLGEAMRVARNAPRTDETADNERALVEALHRAFPQSEWAKRYTTWE